MTSCTCRGNSGRRCQSRKDGWGVVCCVVWCYSVLVWCVVGKSGMEEEMVQEVTHAQCAPRRPTTTLWSKQLIIVSDVSTGSLGLDKQLAQTNTHPKRACRPFPLMKERLSKTKRHCLFRQLRSTVIMPSLKDTCAGGVFDPETHPHAPRPHTPLVEVSQASVRRQTVTGSELLASAGGILHCYL